MGRCGAAGISMSMLTRSRHLVIFLFLRYIFSFSLVQLWVLFYLYISIRKLQVIIHAMCSISRFQVSGCPGLQFSRYPFVQLSRLHDIQVSRYLADWESVAEGRHLSRWELYTVRGTAGSKNNQNMYQSYQKGH